MNTKITFRYVSCTFALLLFIFYSCKTDADLIESANKTVELFVKDLELKNKKSIEKTYPNFNKIGIYWILSNFKINDTKIDGSEIKVYGTYKKGTQIEKPIMFVLGESGSNYVIKKSKGLTAYYESPIYDFLINLGCLTYESDDLMIQEECSKRENTYQSTIEALKSNIESKVSINNSNLSSNYGYYVSGNLLITNNSDFEIPSSCYSIDIGFINSRTLSGVDKQPVQGINPTIQPHQTVSIPITYVPINGGNKFGGIFKITNTIPLQRIFNNIILNYNWDCSKIDNISELN
jgi:hypothetical protein